LRKLTSTSKLREFQRALYQKAKAEPGYRFYSLYDKTYRMDVLEEAYRRVKADRGASGVDGETFAQIEERGLGDYLAELQGEVKERRYTPKPVRRVYIPKAKGKQRPLGIPTIRDRIVQTAYLIVLEPIFEADFTASSFGFRPKKRAQDAVREIHKYLNWGCVENYDVDIEKYFDTVDHRKLMLLLARRIADGQILRVIRQGLSSGYVEDGQHRQSGCGTPQGGVISPLLAKVYLHPVDQAFERKGYGTLCEGSIHGVRYADDLMILAQRDLEKGMAWLEHYIERLGLRLNREKTRRVRMQKGEHVDFVGFRFLYTTNRKTGKRLILIYPSPRSQQRCREEIRKWIHHAIPLSVEEQIGNANVFLRGWVEYFGVGNASATFHDIAHFVEKRVRHVLQRRKGHRGYGGYRIPGERLYGELGLFRDYKVRWL